MGLPPLEEKSFEPQKPTAISSFSTSSYQVREIKPEPRYSESVIGEHKDVNLILSRLDTIKALLDNIDLRLRAVEKEIAKKEEERTW